jgi:hypothetical protein
MKLVIQARKGTSMGRIETAAEAAGARGPAGAAWGAVVLLAIITVLLLGAGGASAAVPPIEVSEYRKDFGVSKAQAEEVLQTQASAAEADIVGDLQDRLGARYAGIWFDNDSGEYVVPLVPGASGKAIHAEFASAALGPDQLRTVPAQSSWAELEAAQEELNRALAPMFAAREVQTSLDPRTNAVVIKQAAGAGVGERDEIRRLAANASVEVKLRESEVNRFGGQLEACTDIFCGQPLRGGVGIFDEFDPDTECTAGFKAIGDSNGSRYLLTAGHCVINFSTEPLSLNWASKDDSLTPHSIGIVEQAEFPGEEDWAKINANTSWWDVDPWLSEVAYWGTPILDGGGAIVGKTPAVNMDYPITGEASSVTGNYACHSGIRTGTTCGYIGELNVTYTWTPTITVHHLIQLLKVCSFSGDSGGSVFSGGKALGMLTGSETDSICEDTILYSDINRATEALGVHIATEGPAVTDQDDNTPGPRAVAQPDGTIDTFYRDGSGNLGHNWYDTGEAGWQSGELPGALATSGVPHAVTQPDGTIDVFFRTPSGELGHTWKGSGPGGEWSSANLPGSVASDPHAVAQTDGTIDVFYRTPSGGLGHNWYDTGEAGWQYGTLPGSLGSDPYLVSQPNGTIDVFFRTPSGALGHTWKGAGAGSEWTSANLPGSVASDPHAVAQTDGTVDVFYRTPSGGLGHNWYDTGGAGWQFNTLAGSVGSAPHIVAQSDGTIDVFFRTPSGELGHTWKSSGPSGEWTSANLPGSVASEPHAVAQPDGTVDVFYRTPSGGLGHNWYDTGEAGWQYGTLGGSVASDPHPVAQSDGTIDVFFRTPSGELGHTWKSSGPSGEWTSANLPGTVAARPPLASTEAATGVSFNEATLKGTVNPEGSVTSYYFEYGTTTSYGSKKPVAGESTGPEAAALSVSQTPTGLAEGTTYHYRVVATSPEGTAYGADKTFKTNSLGTTETTLSVTQVLNGQPGYVTVSGSVKAGSYSLTGQKVKIKYEKETSAGVWTLMNTIERELNAAGTYGYENLEVSQANWRAVAQFQGGATLASSSSSYQAFHVGLGYQLVFAHSSKCVDVQNGSTSNGALIQQWDCLAPATHLNQVFQLVPVGSPWFQIRNINSGRCIDVIGASTANGGWLQQWNCATVGQQKFQLAQPSGGTVALQVAHTGKCVDVNSSSTTSGVILQQWDCQWGNNQRVTFQSVG